MDLTIAKGRRVVTDSRKVERGDVFVAIRGHAGDGHLHVGQAVERGAEWIVGEDAAPESVSLNPARYLQVGDSRFALALLAAESARWPSRSLRMVGITGTSGKTTTSFVVESILRAAGEKVGLIGTVYFRAPGFCEAATHTTPGPIELQDLLTRMRNAGCTAVVMEVSSHALKQHRVAGVEFEGAIFTNLSPEHMDYHPDMDDYYRAKAKLFLELGAQVAAVNGAEEWGKRLIKECAPVLSVQDSSRLKAQAGDEWQVTADGIRGSWRGLSFQSPLTGHYNVENLKSAATLCDAMGVAPEAIAGGISALKSVPGRLERVENQRGIHVWVDYAHKPDALQKVLATLQTFRTQGRLITVMGCGGDRDRTKRPVMGKIARELSDQVIVTSDNPRTEDPQQIIREILAGISDPRSVIVEVDRNKAIHHALRLAQKGDFVLIAGKGHEDYQIVGKVKLPFDDREVAAAALLTLGIENQ